MTERRKMADEEKQYIIRSMLLQLSLEEEEEET